MQNPASNPVCQSTVFFACPEARRADMSCLPMMFPITALLVGALSVFFAVPCHAQQTAQQNTAAATAQADPAKPNPSQASDEPRLVLYLPMDRRSGSIVEDGAGDIWYARVRGTPQWNAGKINNALRLPDRPDTYLELPLPVDWWNEHLDGLTVFMWVKHEGRNGSIFFGAHQPADARLYLAIGEGGHWALGIQDQPWNGAGAIDGRVGADDKWHAVALTLDGRQATFYLDGKPIIQKPYTAFRIAAAPTLGGMPSAGERHGNFAGLIDELAIFDGALPPEAIEQLARGVTKTSWFAAKQQVHRQYLDMRENATKHLVAHWSFDGEEDSEQVFDEGPHGLHGRLIEAERTEGVRGWAFWQRGRYQPGKVEVPDHPALGDWPAMTLEAWVWWDPRSHNMPAMFCKGRDEQLALYLHRYNGHFYVSLATDEATLQTRTSAQLPVYRWSHVALTWDHDTSLATLYVNGEARWKAKLPGTKIRHSKAPLLMAGAAGEGEHKIGTWAGRIDEVKLYRAALPAELIAATYARMAGMAESKSKPRWVPEEPGWPPLEKTCLDPATKKLTYPAFPWPESSTRQPALSAADFPSIQAAVDALPEAGGRVDVPAGVWKINKPIVLRSAVALVGAGEATVIVNENQEGGNAIEVRQSESYRDREYHTPGAKGSHGIVIATLQVRGNPKSGHGIALYDSDHFTVETCWLHFHGQSGLMLSYGEENNLVRGVISKWNAEHGMYIEGCHDTLITNSHFEENRFDGVHVQKDNIQANLLGCNMEDNGRFGVYNKGRWTQVIGCQSDSNEGGAFVFIGPESEYQTVISGNCAGAVRALARIFHPRSEPSVS